MAKTACTVVAVLALIGLTVGLGGGCGGGGGSADDSVVDGPPVLSVTPVDLTGPYDGATDTYGALNFAHNPIIPFGYELHPGVCNPAFEYYTVAGAEVRAASAGVVVWMFENEGIADWEIHVRSHDGSKWVVQYDHVVAPTVAEGERVVAGTVLGGAGIWSATIARTELSVTFVASPSSSTSYCPLDFGTASFNAQHVEMLSAVNARGHGPYASICLTGTCEP